MARNQQSRSKLPLVMMGIGVLLILGSIGWAIFTMLQPAELESQAAPTQAAVADGVPRVSLGDSKAAYDTGGAVFVDVREEAFYDLGHIPGALSIPLDQLPGRLSELDPGDWIITYCS